MIVQLVGYKAKSFVDKKDNREVKYIELNCLIPDTEHGDTHHNGYKFLQFNTTRMTESDCVLGGNYEVVMSDLRPNKDGGYTTKPISLRPLS